MEVEAPYRHWFIALRRSNTDWSIALTRSSPAHRYRGTLILLPRVLQLFVDGFDLLLHIFEAFVEARVRFVDLDLHAAGVGMSVRRREVKVAVKFVHYGVKLLA